MLSAKGVSNDDTLVLYGGNNNWFAAYAYWYFKVYSHRDVRLLDGGRKRWELEGRPLNTDAVTRSTAHYTAQDADLSIRAYRDEVVGGIAQRNIVDVRSPAEFTGEILAPAHFPQEQSQVPGHVPTAVNVPWSKTAADDSSSLPDEQLRALYADAGVQLGTRDTIVYCRFGERSAHTWFVLHELLEQPQVQNYDGSWVEYGSLSEYRSSASRPALTAGRTPLRWAIQSPGVSGATVTPRSNGREIVALLKGKRWRSTQSRTRLPRGTATPSPTESGGRSSTH